MKKQCRIPVIIAVALVAVAIVGGIVGLSLIHISQMDAPGGEVQGEILRLCRAAAQQRRAGIVEGIVGGVIVLLPADGAQDAGCLLYTSRCV